MKKIIVLIVVLVFLCGCNTGPKNQFSEDVPYISRIEEKEYKIVRPENMDYPEIIFDWVRFHNMELKYEDVTSFVKIGMNYHYQFADNMMGIKSFDVEQQNDNQYLVSYEVAKYEDEIYPYHELITVEDNKIVDIYEFYEEWAQEETYAETPEQAVEYFCMALDGKNYKLLSQIGHSSVEFGEDYRMKKIEKLEYTILEQTDEYFEVEVVVEGSESHTFVDGTHTYHLPILKENRGYFVKWWSYDKYNDHVAPNKPKLTRPEVISYPDIIFEYLRYHNQEIYYHDIKSSIDNIESPIYQAADNMMGIVDFSVEDKGDNQYLVKYSVAKYEDEIYNFEELLIVKNNRIEEIQTIKEYE